MLIVKETFVCKPGQASKFAKKCKEAMEGLKEVKYILTDMSGSFNRVVIVSEYANLSDFENNWEKYKEDAEAMKKMEAAMAGYQDMYLTGSREFFKTW